VSFGLARPEALWLLLIALPWVALWAHYSLADASFGMRVLQAAVRVALCACLVLALSRPFSVQADARVAAVLLLDVSASLSDDQLEAARTFVEGVHARRGRNDVRLVTCARTAQAVPLSEDEPVPDAAALRHTGAAASEATDIGAAIALGRALIPPGRVPRLVLLSDGRDTGGGLWAAAQAARASGVAIHAIPPASRAAPEALIRAVEVPPRIDVGEPFGIRVALSSSHPQPVRVTVDQDGLPNPGDPERQIVLAKGGSEVTFRARVREPGLVRYRVRLRDARRDTHAANNDFTVPALVAGRPRVLLIDGEPSEARSLEKALDRAGLIVDLRGPSALPGRVEDLARWDLVILSDVPPGLVGPRHARALEEWVRGWGGGLLFSGGTNAFGEGGWAVSRVESLLPVRFDAERRREEPRLGLMLVMDKSGSMAGAKIDLAKEAARATAELLDPTDLIGVIAFDSQPTWLVRLQRAASRVRISNDITHLAAGGGTSILPALREARRELAPARARVKHLILLSDGQSPEAGVLDLVRDAVRDGITFSTVGVGEGADRTLLAQIAEKGKGRFYFTHQADHIPRIFTRETSEVARSALDEGSTRVWVVRSAEVLAGIDFESAPPLRGHVVTRAKKTAEPLLATGDGDPILVRWRLGLGRTAAFLSDAKARWAADWIRWPGFAKLWTQLARDSMRRPLGESFRMRASAEDGRVNAVIDAIDRSDRFVNALTGDVVALPTGTNAGSVAGTVVQVAPGRYATTLDLAPGAWLLRATLRSGSDGEVVGEAQAAVGLGYPDEYAELEPDLQRLRQLAAVTGGRFAPTPEQVFDTGGEIVRFPEERWLDALALAVALLIMDVALRRLVLLGRRDRAAG